MFRQVGVYTSRILTAPSRRTCRWCSRPSSSWSSMPKPRGYSISRCRRRYSPPPTRSSNSRGRGQVFFLRAFLRVFGVDARRWLRWILNLPRRSFKLRVLVNRQQPMKNVTFDRTSILQLDANGTDSALDAAADCHVLRNDAALDMCAIADLEIRGAQLAFDSAEDLSWTFAFDLADDRHVGADARSRSRFCQL